MRSHAGLTQEKLAEVAGVEQTTISQIELGKIRSPLYDTVAKLAKALGSSPERVADAIAQSVKRRKAVA